MAIDNGLNIKVETRNNTGKGFKAARDDMEKTGKAAKELGGDAKEMGDDFDRAGKDVQQFGDEAKKTGKELDNLEDEVDGAADAAKGAETKFSASFLAMATAATAAAGTIGAAVTSAFSQAFDKQGAKGAIAAKLGLNDEDAARVGKIQGELYANAYGESMGELSDVSAYAIRALGGDMASITDGEIAELSKGLINLGTTFETGFEESADAVRGMISNDLVGSVDEALDVLTKGLQIDPSGDIVDTFREYGTELKQVGLSAEQFLSMANAGIQAGARNTDLLADAIKESNIIMQEGTDASADALEGLGYNAKSVQKIMAEGGPKARETYQEILLALTEVDDKAKQNEYSVALLGTKYEDLGDDVIEAMANASGSFTDLENAAENMDKNINNNFGTMFETIKRQLGSGLSEALLPVAEQVMESLSNVDWGAVGDQIKSALEGLAPIFKAIVWGLKRMGELFAFIGEHKTLFGVLAAAMGAVAVVVGVLFAVWAAGAAAAALATIGATWPILAIAAVVGAVAYLIIKYWDEISAAAIAVWDWISEKASDAWDWIKETFTSFKDWLISAWNTISEPIIAVWNLIWAGIQLYLTLVKAYLSIVIGVILAVWDSIKEPIIAVWNAVWQATETILNTIWGVIQMVIDGIIATWNMIKEPIIAVWDAIKQPIAKAIFWIQHKIEDTVNKIREKWAFFKLYMRIVWSAIKSTVSNFVQKIYDNTIGKIQAMIDKIVELKNKIGSISVSGVRDKVGGVLPKFADGGTHGLGGLALVGERGPELVRLGAGSHVMNNPTSRAYRGGGGAGGGGTTVIHLHGAYFGERDIQKVVKDTLQGGGFAGAR